MSQSVRRFGFRRRVYGRPSSDNVSAEGHSQYEIKWQSLRVAAMKPRNYQSSIPTSATEIVEDAFDGGAKKSAFFFLRGEKVGFRQWSEGGELEVEYGMRNGTKHGRWYRFYENGQPEEVIPYRNGRMHGTGKQWSPDGELLITYKLVNGAGLDLWCGHENNTLAEECYWPKDGELGISPRVERRREVHLARISLLYRERLSWHLARMEQAGETATWFSEVLCG